MTATGGPGAALVVVDGMNVIGSGAGGWWRDRPAAQRRLHQRLAALAHASAATVMVVFEGPTLADLGEGTVLGVEVRWARRRGRDAADDRIVEEVAAGAGRGPVTVVTADRGLRARVTAVGAATVGPRQLEAALGS
jgi:predicted RNA-binding protein with PIN domain